MKRYFAMLLVVMMLAGSFVSYADKVNDGEIELKRHFGGFACISALIFLDLVILMK